jgi:hypothetical protein
MGAAGSSGSQLGGPALSSDQSNSGDHFHRMGPPLSALDAVDALARALTDIEEVGKTVSMQVRMFGSLIISPR